MSEAIPQRDALRIGGPAGRLVDGDALMRRVHARLALAGFHPLMQKAYLAVRSRCPICGPQDGFYRPLQVGCYGEKTAPRWACELNCDTRELDRLMLAIFEGSDHVE